MQNAAFRAASIEARYIALDAADFAASWSAVRRLEVRGGNVTLPWKEAACEALDFASPEALLARAANTFWRTPEGALAGMQTDGEGFLRAIGEDFGLAAADLRAVVLGAGGGARSVLHALAGAGAAALYVWNRTRASAVRVADEIRAAGFGSEVVVLGSGNGGNEEGPEARALSGPTAIPALPSGHVIDLLVNATSVAVRGEEHLRVEPRQFPGLRFALDLAYGPDPTPFLNACARSGARTADGRGMLLHQGARSFELWFGRPAPLETMRAALQTRLAG